MRPSALLRRRTQILEPLPLILTQHASKAEQHARIGLLQFGASLRNAIDLRHDFRFIRMLSFKQRLNGRFFFLQSGTEIDQLQAALLKDGLDAALLVRSQAQLLD